MEAVAVSKQHFSEYLNECGFYFANIANPDKTLFGDKIKDADKKKGKGKSKKNKKKDGKELEANPLHNSKLANYFQIVNSVQ